jgi:hypothetical protein
MVPFSKLKIGFKQSGNTCVLASYGIASNYFTSLPVESFFEDYCKHYKINPPTLDFEKAYDAHFHEELKKQRISGYELIVNLHKTSAQKCFVESRGRFTTETILNTTTELGRIELILKKDNVLLLLTRNFLTDYHSCVVGFDNDSFYLIETMHNYPDFYRKTSIDQFRKLPYSGELRDSVLIIPH